MTTNVANQTNGQQSSATDHVCEQRSSHADLEQWLDDLREAMGATGWTPESIDAHWNTSRGYAGRLCRGEKPWSLERILALPADLKAELDRLRAQRSGWIVGALVSREEGIRQLFCGLVSVITNPSALELARHTAKATLRDPLTKAVNV
jgi:hypothetical protein